MPLRKQIHGAKWWKFDFHNHTPASTDYGKGDLSLKEMSPREWLLMYMNAEIDCVAVTDHNSGEWIDKLNQALKELEEEKPEGYRPLYIFPGVEITASGNCHILAIFEIGKQSSDISALLGAVGFPSDKFGTSDAVTEKSLTQVIEAVIRTGAIVIPAHVDKPSGLFLESGYTLQQALGVEGLLAIELIDKAYEKPEIYKQMKVHLTEVVGTDSHMPGQVGTNYTWVKMHKPSLDSLRLALHDGEDGVIRKEDAVGDPNLIQNRYFIKSITVHEAYKAGRRVPLLAKFSPWLSSIIGGRGCGKSSLINFLRLALSRLDDMPQAIQEEFNQFKKVGARQSLGMLTSETKIQVEIFKDAKLYRISLKCCEEKYTIEEWDNTECLWVKPVEVTNIPELFPIQVFSQKQLYALTTEPSKIIELIDSQFNKEEWQEEKDKLVSKWLSNRLRKRELQYSVNEESNVDTQLSAVKSKIALFESSDYKETLSDFNISTSINNFFNETSSKVESFIESIENVIGRVPNVDIPEDLISKIDSESKAFIEDLHKSISEAKSKVEESITVLTSYKGNLLDRVNLLPWKTKFDDVKNAYNLIVDNIKAIGNDSYETLIQKRNTLQEKLNQINANKSLLSELKLELERNYNDIISCEKKLREKRKKVIDNWTSNDGSDNPFLIVELCSMSNEIEANESFRELLRRSGDEFSKYIYDYNEETDTSTGIISDIINSSEEERWGKREEVIKRLLTANENEQNGFDRRLIRHIANLKENTPEDIDRLLIWTPEDKVVLKFKKEGRIQDIQAGSAGEKVAGMLGLLLALNDVPLVIDQPEDDLDTSLISNFVVPGFRKLKQTRQLILVTHNPNIAVNANSDNVIHMNFHAGQIIVARNSALQDKEIRLAVCDVMEGGRDALNKRYYRISKALKT